MKRILALLLAIIIVLPILPANIFAAEAVSYYEKVSLPADELEEGVYVFVNSLNGATRLMKTESTEDRDRIGFKADNTTIAEGESISELLPDYEWTLTKAESGKWLVGANGKYIKLASVSGKGIAATLEDVGDEFTITLNNGKYELSNGTNVLNANGSRPIFNGYANQPARFNLFKKADIKPDVPKEDGYYESISKPASDLEEGTYVIVHNVNSKNYFVKPEALEKNGRTGLNLVETDIVKPDSIEGELSGFEWTFTKEGDKWLIGANGKYIKISTASNNPTTLESEGDLFEVAYKNGKYEFSTGSLVLNYNSRGVIKGYGSSPASFTLYKKTVKAVAESAYYGKTSEVVADLEEGSYLFVHDISSNIDIDSSVTYRGSCLVMPSSVAKDGRQGLDLLKLDDTQTELAVKTNSIEGIAASYEWTLTRTSGGKWLLGSKSGYAKITEISGIGGTSIALTSADDAGEFTVENSGGTYTFSSVYNGKTYYLNFNKRMVINGWDDANKAAHIALYKKTDKPEEVKRNYPITVVACSDFQNPNGNDAGAAFVGSILNRIKADNPKADLFLCAGDYNYGYGSTDSGISALSSVVKEAYGNDVHEVYVEGNHDDFKAELLAKSGNNDPEDNLYGVFVINEDDYMWGSNPSNSDSHPGMTAEAIIKQTASNLQAYLSTKLAQNYTAPIFIVSHLPLHYSMRTRNDGDGMYANYLFDVMNDAADDGLNIIYLYGHDHSHGWDDYLGGSAVYLAKGQKINIAQSSRTNFKTETLGFTYMNAGFVGYYEDLNGGDATLTMSTFTVTEDSVVVSRYSENGVYRLKSAGVHNNHRGETDSHYPVDSTVTSSPQTIALNKEINAPVTFKDEATGICITSKASNISIAQVEDKNFKTSKYREVKIYEISGENLTKAALIEVPVGRLTAASCKIFVLSENSKYLEIQPDFANGKASFKLNRFTKFAVCELNPESGYYKQTIPVDELDEGTYVIVYESSFMKPDSVKKESNGNGLRQGFDLIASSNINVPVIKNRNITAYEWTLTKTEDGKWHLGSKSGYAQLANVDGVGGNSAVLVEDEALASAFTIANTGDSYTFESTLNGNTLFLNFNNRGLINGYPEVAKAATFNLYKKVVVEKPTNPSAPTDKKIGLNGFIYVNKDYHAFIINGRLIAYPHDVNDFGRCNVCCERID